MRGQPSYRLLPSIFATLAILSGAALAQDQIENEEDLHRFRDKEGHEIDAKIVSFSSDWRQVQIERADGHRFDLIITRLSLDDQQFLRNWLLNRELPDPSSLRFDLSLNRLEKSSAKQKLANLVDEATWEAQEVGFQIGVTNLSRLPLANLRLEYCLLVEDAVEVKPTAVRPLLSNEDQEDIDEATPLWRAKRDKPLHYQFGSVELPPLAFNRVHQVDTASLVRDAITPERSSRLGLEDRLVGIMVRVTTGKEVVVAEKADLIRDYAAIDWAVFLNRRDPSETESGTGELVEAMVAN